MSRRITGAFNRVEGDLEVTLEVEEGRVRSARVTAGLFRGFEQMLQGRVPEDALVYVPRICGICSVAQSSAAAGALAEAQGLAPARNGRLAANLVLACENLADHLTHFYLFFMPDFTRDAYRGRPWFSGVEARFRPVSGSAVEEVLAHRARFLHLTGALAGKWPHSLSIRPGGTTAAVDGGGKVRLRGLLHAFRRFLERTLFGGALEEVAALSSAEALDRWATASGGGDLRRFLEVAEDLELERLGRGVDHFLSYGAYPGEEGHLFGAGSWVAGVRRPPAPEAVREDAASAWMQDPEPRHPFGGITRPRVPDTGDSAYSWCKAPRLDGLPMETGALARQVVDGHPLIADLVDRAGGNVRNRVLARMLELALVVPAMERWVEALRPGEPFCREGRVPAEARGAGLVEAARGSLGHWLEVRRGRIRNYQIVAPTTWNFSPRDASGVPGPLEQALEGTPVAEGEREPAAVAHVVRSFDPCMVCTVH